MWVEVQNRNTLINLERVDILEVGIHNSIVCKYGEKSVTLGNFSSKEKAERVLNEMKYNVYQVPKDKDLYD